MVLPSVSCVVLNVCSARASSYVSRKHNVRYSFWRSTTSSRVHKSTRPSSTLLSWIVPSVAQRSWPQDSSENDYGKRCLSSHESLTGCVKCSYRELFKHKTDMFFALMICYPLPKVVFPPTSHFTTSLCHNHRHLGYTRRSDARPACPYAAPTATTQS